MNWNAVKFDWNHARAFLVTAREGSLSAAAIELGLTQPTLSRQVSGLEDSLNVVLFEKFGRGLALTPAGHDLLSYVEKMGDAAANLNLIASGKSQDLSGSVCISSPEYTSAFVMPLLANRIQQKYPLIQINLVAANEKSDLKRREADIAVRSFQPTELDFIAKKIRSQSWGLYVSTRYFENQGKPNCIAEIEKLDFIGPNDIEISIKHLAKLNLKLTERNFRITSNNMLVQWQSLCLGFGVAFVPNEVAEGLPNLTRLLAEQVSPESERWLVTHREMRLNRKVREVFELMSRELEV
jgi:DNA-binding transcriptional LysR family regulator